MLKGILSLLTLFIRLGRSICHFCVEFLTKFCQHCLKLATLDLLKQFVALSSEKQGILKSCILAQIWVLLVDLNILELRKLRCKLGADSLWVKDGSFDLVSHLQILNILKHTKTIKLVNLLEFFCLVLEGFYRNRFLAVSIIYSTDDDIQKILVRAMSATGIEQLEHAN